MISEIVLTIVIIALLGYIGWSNYSVDKEREKLMKLFMARNLQEVTENEVVEKIQPNKPAAPIPSDLQEISPDDDESFDRHIEKQLEVNAKDN